MGIVIGISEILLGLYELWTGAKFTPPSFHRKIKGLYSRIFLYWVRLLLDPDLRGFRFPGFPRCSHVVG